MLDRAVREAPGDVEAAADRAFALWLVDRRQDAFAVCESTLDLGPTSELALGDAAFFAVTLGRRERAIEYWRRLLKVNPWQDTVDFDIARALAEGGKWDEALRLCRQGLRIDPMSVKGRLFLVMYHAKHGEPKLARSEFDIVLALKPPNEETLRRWFASLGLPEQ